MNGKPPVPAGPLLLRDFPDRLPAMVVKELRQGLRATMFTVPFVLVHLAAILAVELEYRNQSARDLFSPFWIVTVVMVAFVMPLRGFSSLREECAGGNSALLILGGLSRWQIVRGKWLVQTLLGGLMFVSLLPYLLVRYFLGGLEIVPNALMALNVFVMAGGVSGCVIGASGYPAPGLRFVVAGLGIFWVSTAAIFTFNAIGAMDQASYWKETLLFWLAYTCALGVQFLYAVTGLQLGRAHLKLYLRPQEIPPTRAVVALMFFLPFILLAGAIGALFWGFPLVLLIVILAMCRYDRHWRKTSGTRKRSSPLEHHSIP